MIFYGVYYVHHIITFCFLPYFPKKIFRGELNWAFKNFKKFQNSVVEQGVIVLEFFNAEISQL